MKKIFKFPIYILFPLLLGIYFYKTNNSLPILRNYLPDFLWAYSLTWALKLFNWSGLNNLQIFYFSFITSVAYEIAQKLDIFDGTFDPMDIIVYCFGILLAYLLFKFHN